MKPFNLEEALAGAKVITGCGEPATDIAYFPSENSVYKVGAVINGGVRFFTVDGHFRDKKHDFICDLFMAPVKSEGWINIYKSRKLGYCVHKTEEEAQASSSGRIACVRIEWEECEE
jgi:hypothetical protein